MSRAPATWRRSSASRWGNVSDHTRVLVTLGAIELVDTQPRRGALEHYYRAALDTFLGDRDQLPAAARQALIDAAILK